MKIRRMFSVNFLIVCIYFASDVSAQNRKSVLSDRTGRSLLRNQSPILKIKNLARLFKSKLLFQKSSQKSSVHRKKSEPLAYLKDFSTKSSNFRPPHNFNRKFVHSNEFSEGNSLSEDDPTVENFSSYAILSNTRPHFATVVLNNPHFRKEKHTESSQEEEEEEEYDELYYQNINREPTSQSHFGQPFLQNQVLNGAFQSHMINGQTFHNHITNEQAYQNHNVQEQMVQNQIKKVPLVQQTQQTNSAQSYQLPVNIMPAVIKGSLNIRPAVQLSMNDHPVTKQLDSGSVILNNLKLKNNTPVVQNSVTSSSVISQVRYPLTTIPGAENSPVLQLPYQNGPLIHTPSQGSPVSQQGISFSSLSYLRPSQLPYSTNVHNGYPYMLHVNRPIYAESGQVTHQIPSYQAPVQAVSKLPNNYPITQTEILQNKPNYKVSHHQLSEATQKPRPQDKIKGRPPSKISNSFLRPMEKFSKSLLGNAMRPNAFIKRNMNKLMRAIYPYYHRPKLRYPYYDKHGNGKLLYGYGAKDLFEYNVFRPLRGYMKR